MNYKSLYPRLVGASDGIGLRSQIHLVARLRPATSVDTKYSKLLGNKSLSGKLAFFQLNYSRSASVLNIARTVVCELARNRPAWESEILALTVVFLHLPTRYSTRTRQVG